MSEISKAVIDSLKCECVIFKNENDNIKLFKEWKRLFELGKEEGFLPLVIASHKLFFKSHYRKNPNPKRMGNGRLCSYGQLEFLSRTSSTGSYFQILV